MSMAIKVARIQSQGSGRVMPGVGDPGLFSFLGSAIKGAAGLIPGPIGAIARRVFKPSVPVSGTQPILVSNGQMTTSRFQQAPDELLGPPRPGVPAMFQRAFMGGKTGRFEAQGGMSLACPTGHHPNKSDYFLKDGTFVQKGTQCVKNRRRNPLNARAADRAISRIESAKRATKRLGRVTIKKKC